MGNAQARKRIKASDFDYLAKNTNFLTLEVGEMTENQPQMWKIKCFVQLGPGLPSAGWA